MKLQRALLALACGALLVTKASAVTLSWSGGSTNVSFTAATRCTLIATVDAPDTTLPADLRLSRVARNCPELKLVAEAMPDPNGLQARVDELVAPSPLESITQHRSVLVKTPADSYASARFLIDLPVTARGNIRAVYSLPTGGAGTSNVVTFNSGIGATFAPVVLGSRTAIENDVVVIRATGVGLSSTVGAKLATADTSWSESFNLTQKDDTSMTARNVSLSILPQACLQLEDTDGDMSAITSSEAATPQGPAPFDSSVIVRDTSYKGVVLKDFAIVYDVERNAALGKWEGLYHLYYIRQTPDGFGKVLAHQWSPDLVNWAGPDTTEFRAGDGGGTWDQFEVWAPSLIKRGNLWYMFYTGVDAQGGNQSIGYATKMSLRPNTGAWTRKTTASVTRSITNWIEPSGSAQFRDPFVVSDPARIGKWLMFFVGLNNSGLPAGNSVGVLREKDVADLVWEHVGRYRATDAQNAFDTGDESPHVFRDPNLPYHWRIMWTASGAAPQNSIHFIHNPRGIALGDVDSLQWGSDEGKPRLFQYSGQNVGFGWAGTEFLHTGEYYQPNTGQPAADHLVPPRGYTDLLAGYLTTGNVSGIEITKVTWSGYGTGFNDHQDFTLHAVRGAVAGVGPSRANLPMLRAVRSIMHRPGVAAVVRMPSSAFAQVEVIDVAGRRLRELWHGALPAGDHELAWDLRDETGTVLRPGLTFLRLETLGRSEVKRIVVLK